MPFGDDKPSTWASATRMLRGTAAKGDIGDKAIWGDDPLDPELQKKPERGNNPTSYLDGFRDTHIEEGHNTGAPGHRKPRSFHEGSAAKLGYRVIPGNASTGYIERKTRAVMDAVDAKLGGTVPRGPIGAPVGHTLRHRDREAKRATGPGVGPLASAHLPSKRR